MTLLQKLARLFRPLSGASPTLPTFVEALGELLPPDRLQQLLATSEDPRFLGRAAALQLGISEEALVSLVGKALGLPCLFRLPLIDPDNLPKELTLSDCRRYAALPLCTSSLLSGLALVDPGLCPLLLPEIKGVPIYLTSWTKLSSALSQSERQFIDRQAVRSPRLTEEQKGRARQALELIMDQALRHDQSYADLQLSEAAIRFEFLTKSGQIASGTVDPALYPALVALQDTSDIRLFSQLEAFDGECFRAALKAVKPNRQLRLTLIKEIGCPPAPGAVGTAFRTKPTTEAELTTVKKILLVDDNTTFLAVLESFLKRKGYEGISCLDTGAAWAVITDPGRRPELVVCDIHLLGESGMGLLTRIKCAPGIQSIPVLMLSSDDSIDTKILALRGGAEACLAKSEDPRILLAHIERLLQRPALADIPEHT